MAVVQRTLPAPAAAARPRARLARREWSLPAWLVEAGTAWLISRCALLAVFLFAGHLGSLLGHVPAASFDRWDSVWYARIAIAGYWPGPSPNFFPLLPLLMAGGGRLAALGAAPTHFQALMAGVVIANLAALGAFLAVAALVQREDGPRVAGATVRLLAAYPFAFFLAAAYTDGLFLALAAGAILAARSRRWWLAVPAGLAAGLLRPTAPLLVLPLAWEALSSRGKEGPAKLAAVLAAPVGTALYAAYLWWQFGDPLLFVNTQKFLWNHQLWPFWQTLALAAANAFQPGAGIAGLDLAVAIALLALLVLMARRLPAAFVLYAAAVVLLPLMTPTPRDLDPIHSMGRYALAAFPAFWLLGRWVADRPRLELGLVSVGLMLQAPLAIAFLYGGGVY